MLPLEDVKTLIYIKPPEGKQSDSGLGKATDMPPFAGRVS
jgi:hypothetical protein